MRKTHLPILFAVVATVLALAGCATGGASPDQAGSAGTVPELSPDQQVDIVFESYNLAQAGAWSDVINGLIADFQAEHPNIHVKGQPPQGATGSTATASSVQTQLLAGHAPDVAQITFDSVDFTVNELGAKSVEDIAGKEAVEENFGGTHPFHPRAATLADWEGKTYGVPYVFSTPVLFYNATALQNAGLPADTDLSSWAEVEAAAKAVTAKTGKPSLSISCAVKGGSWCMQGIFRSAGGDVLSPDRKTIEFGAPPAVSAVTMLRNLYDEGVLVNQDSTTQYEDFAKGGSVIHLNTSALQATFIKSAQAAGWDLRAAPMPGFDGKQAVPTNSGSALFVFSDDPAKQRASWELIKYMTSDHAYTEISSKIGYLPLRTSLTQDPAALKGWADTNPLLAPNLAQLDRLEPWKSYPGNNYTQVDDILAQAIEQSVFYGKDPATTMQAAQVRAQDLIN
jgi:multiple sugar transport system substrate-binding protein